MSEKEMTDQKELDKIFFKNYHIKPIKRNEKYVIRKQIQNEITLEKIRLTKFLSKVTKIPDTVRMYID